MGKGSSTCSSYDHMTDECRSARKKIATARELYLKRIRSATKGHIDNLGTTTSQKSLQGEPQGTTTSQKSLQGEPQGTTTSQKSLQGKPQVSEVPEAVFKDETKNSKYPFENLVLEGGGAKGIAYCGLIKVLEEHGILQKIKRFAGTSAGAITAALLAVGYNSYEVEKILGVDFERLLYDSCMLMYPLHLCRGYGVNTGKRFDRVIGDLLALKTTNPDVTFEEVYVRFNKELCLVVVNVDTSEVEYCHVKTTPEMPVRLAVRMSMSLPVIFQAVKYKHSYFVDGGLLCNYPIHCFDGWFLSMEMENAFFNRIKSLHNLQKDMCLENRFKYDQKKNTTLGGMVYCDGDGNLHKEMLEQSNGVPLEKLPDTVLARKYARGTAYDKELKREYEKTVEAIAKFYEVLTDHNEHNSRINKKEFMAAFIEQSFTAEYKTLLFGEGYDSETAWVAVNKYGRDEVQFTDITSFIESTGVSMLEAFKDHERKGTSSLLAFLKAMILGLSESTMQPFFKSTDVDRTIGINTWYVQATTFKLKEGDKTFLIKQGRDSTMKFLDNFLDKNGLYKLTGEEMKNIILPQRNPEDERKLKKIIDL